MIPIHKKAESGFESFASAALRVFGSPVTFILAVILVIFYLATIPYGEQTLHNTIYDFIHCFTFLGFFIIQKAVNKSGAAMNLKINELISSHEKASNRLVNIETKTEAELRDLGKHYEEISKESEESGALHTARSIEHKIKPGKNDPGIEE